MTFPVALDPSRLLQRLSPRERVLALIVGGGVFLLANLLAVTTLLGSFQELRRACADQSLDLEALRVLAREAPKWDQRMQWLRAKQPVLASRDRAGAELLVQIQQFARASGVLLKSQQPVPFNAADNSTESGSYQPVTVKIDTQSDWPSVKEFIRRLQQPESFLVFDSATLQSDVDPHTLKGHFQISKWYAPAAP